MEAEPAVTKADTAFRTLREAIELGRYHPGAHLRVQQLVQELGMSPTPIREALRLLQAEGLVTHHPHRGTMVAEYSPEDAVEIYRLRLVLEPMGAELAAQRASDAQRAEIRALHDELGTAIDAETRTDAAELNLRWHRAVMAASDSRYLQEFASRLWQALPARSIWLTSRAQKSYEQHAAITAALEAGDAQRAKDLMRKHISFGAVSTVDHLRAVGHNRAR